MRHTVFSETRPSLMQERGAAGTQAGCAGAGSRPRTPSLPVLFLPLEPDRPAPREGDSLRDGVLRGLDLAEELLWDAVVEGELAIQHGEQHHAQGPHVAGLAPVRPACRAHRHTRAQPRAGEERPCTPFPGTPRSPTQGSPSTRAPSLPVTLLCFLLEQAHWPWP